MGVAFYTSARSCVLPSSVLRLHRLVAASFFFPFGTVSSPPPLILASSSFGHKCGPMVEEHTERHPEGLPLWPRRPRPSVRPEEQFQQRLDACNARKAWCELQESLIAYIDGQAGASARARAP